MPLLREHSSQTEATETKSIFSFEKTHKLRGFISPPLGTGAQQSSSPGLDCTVRSLGAPGLLLPGSWCSPSTAAGQGVLSVVPRGECSALQGSTSLAIARIHGHIVRIWEQCEDRETARARWDWTCPASCSGWDSYWFGRDVVTCLGWLHGSCTAAGTSSFLLLPLVPG